MLYSFMCDNWTRYKEMLVSQSGASPFDIGVISLISHKYQICLMENEEEDFNQDEFMKMACMFFHMSDDFILSSVLLFSRLYRNRTGVCLVGICVNVAWTGEVCELIS